MNSTVFSRKNKLFLTIIAIILVIPAILAIYFASNATKSANLPHDVTKIYIHAPTGEDYYFEQSDIFQIYNKAIQNAREITADFRDLSAEKPFEVVFTEADDTSKQYAFYMKNSTDECIYTDAEGKYYLISDEDAISLLARDEYINVNTSAIFPYAFVGNNNVTLKPTAGEWTHKMVDNSSEKEAITESTENTELVKISATNIGALSFGSSRKPDKVNVVLSSAGAIKHDGPYENLLNSNVMQPNDTYYDMTITAVWEKSEETSYHGTLSYTAKLLYDVSPTYKLVNQSTVSKGDFTIIKIQNFNDSDLLYVQSDFPFPETLKVFPSSKGYSYAFLPADYALDGTSARHKITFMLADSTAYSTNVTVADGRAPAVKEQEMLVADISLAQCFTEESFEEMSTVISQANEQSGSVALWEGKFVYPDQQGKGTIGSSMACFGTKRTIDAAGLFKKTYTHNGIDIKVEEGSSVRAANNGVVVFAGNLALTGNTVIIDHGCSILTYYGHLESISVEKGDVVTKASEIAKAGSTGFAVESNGVICTSAPQIHFATSVEGVFVNPYYLCRWGVDFDD